MDYLTSLKLFRTIVETKSFARTADVFGVSPPVVSRTIATLEQRFGNRLFHRTTRHISLTETAEQLFAGRTRVLDEPEALEAVATHGATAPTGMLRIVAHTTVTVGCLVPLITSFRRECPLVGLDILLAERPVDLVSDGFDVAIVLPFMLTTDTAVTRLLERMPLVVVAAPGYLAGRAPVPHPLALSEHEFVAMHASIRKPVLTFLVDGEELVVPIRTEITSNNVVLNRELVLEGFGMGILPAALVREEIASGKLVTVLDDFPVMDGSVEMRIAYSSRTLLPAKVRAFVDHASGFFEAGH